MHMKVRRLGSPPEVEEYANVRLIVGQDIEVMDAGHWRHCRMCSVLL